MTVTSKTIQGVGESGCLEHASFSINGEGNSRRYMFSFTTQQPCSVEEDHGTVNLIINGEQEFADIIKFINEATSS